MDRNDLLNEIYAGRTRLEAALARLTPQQMTEPDLPAGWSVKDLLAHLGWWEQRVVEIYNDLVQGQSPARPINEEQLDAVNAQILEQFRARDLEAVRQYEGDAYHQLIRLVEIAPAADLFDPARFAFWSGGVPFSQWIQDNSVGHYDEHWPSLESKLAEDRVVLRAPSTETGEPVQDVDVAAQAELNPVVQRAADFLEREGRDIDKALLRFRFGALPVRDALDVLGRYQNEDGGFAGLEVDIKAPASNPFATEQALRILTWLDPPRDHPLVLSVLHHLETTQDEDGGWRFTPEIYEHGLAPWFQGWQWPNLNPACTTSGLLKELGMGSDRLHTRVQALFDRLATPDDLSGEYYNVRPYAYYFQTEWDFPQADFYRTGVVDWLVRQHQTNPDLDASHFMDFAPRPASAISRRLPPEVLQAKLDQLLAEQSPDGGWPTPYDPAWRSWNTISNLLILRSYGKI